MSFYSGTVRGHFALLASGLSLYTSKAWMLAILTTALALVVIGLPTAIYENPFFVRMTPVRPQDYVIWVLSSVLIGLIVGSYFAAGSTTGEGKVLSGGVLSVLSVGCPTCNQLVVLFLGTGGALSFFAPLQIYIGIASVLLLAWTLVLRTKALAGTCTVSDLAR
jgi:predicted membrane protein